MLELLPSKYILKIDDKHYQVLLIITYNEVMVMRLLCRILNVSTKFSVIKPLTLIKLG